jgi:hypothetical protein
MAMPREKLADCWEIRCRFNRSGYDAKLASGEFSLIEKKKPARVNSAKVPANCKYSIEWYYIHAVTQDEMAHGHCYEFIDQTQTPRDPKHLYLNGTRYALHRGNGWWRDKRRDPASFFEHGSWLRETYVGWRRIKCKLFGR